MVLFCCVPLCGTDSYRSDQTITFHEFPSNPDLAAKWIKQINSAVTTKQKPMWFPRGRPVICSKHFLHTDFKEDSDSLKPHSIPTVFGYKYIGFNQNIDDNQAIINGNKKSPLIVKVNKPSSGESSLISNAFSQSDNLNNPYDEYPKTFSSVSSHSETLSHSSSDKNSFIGSLQYRNNNLSHKISESFKISPAIGNSITKSTTVPKIGLHGSNMIQKKKVLKKDNTKNELIEIGPSTFLKINPDIIKVNKKQTPAGNTVLQFIMDQKLANQASNLLPKIVRTFSTNDRNSPKNQNREESSMPSNISETSVEDDEIVVEQVVGHLVDTHVCQETCNDFKDIDNDEGITILDDDEPSNKPYNSNQNCIDDTPAADSNSIATSPSKSTLNAVQGSATHKTVNNYLNKAPILLTTNLPLSHCLTDKPKYALQIKQKSKQIASLKLKVGTLTKKIEELEDKCIVQERQLSYSFIKRLKTIRKNAAKGDPCATYILEQIRCYTGKTKMRWSDSTLTQCAVWCRKAPYAYEYFKKADFFKLPCLGTVKRYMKKHPELKFQNKSNPLNPNESDSSSDFDFDDSDSEKEGEGNSDVENIEPASACDAVLSESQGVINSEQTQMIQSKPVDPHSTQNIPTSLASLQQDVIDTNSSIMETSKVADKSDKPVELNPFPMAVDGSNIEIQEIILPSGEVVQCYASNLCNGTEVGNQYYIIPNVGDQTSGMEHEYNVVQTAESLPVILQNLDNCQLNMQQDQYIFVANSLEQVEGPETEVVTAPV